MIFYRKRGVAKPLLLIPLQSLAKGIPQLLEMLALQSEVLELHANPKMRARGAVLESEMHKGLGAVARVLVQNGTLSLGDAIAFERHWGRVKTMHDEHGKLTICRPLRAR